jgi:hypothetical protein
MSTIRRIRDAVRAGSDRFSDHALDEMDDDSLEETDMRHVLLTGVVRMELTNDPRGVRYVVRGRGRLVEVDVVCRFLRPGCCELSRSMFREVAV